MKKLNIKHILSCIFAAGVVFAFASCSDDVVESAQNGCAYIKMENGVERYFDFPQNGHTKIYAEKIKAIEDSSVDAYDILAQTEIDEKSRYYTLNVYFVPGHTKNGNWVNPKAEVRISEYSYENSYPKTWFYVIDDNANSYISLNDYSIPSGKGGILSLNISADNLHSFETYEAFTGYCELTYQLDPLLRCSIEAPLNY
ncbi:MAG: hypothetical protein SO116_06035 [Treponema sp.]|nr:hypothetical protein [Spirochaetia bacterium]MDD7015296.1 hypothetical protein [Spirochaetales bacterium]MDY4902415.1 hypothetical protein [Treponema sp.]